ncbi:hypothetical protein FK531_13490 [Rhodococcus spelaei]|uniref:Secreted protein n=1 Tax=Rhodococcus spelaei TaxID=2546320 RepID=A0A541B8Y6_9NOCA|nr:hypothetical protein [Rhodococcus spelaei]TQF68802.1 hypothetical protein FK531_13490 [Rhodococcus spelaei]
MNKRIPAAVVVAVASAPLLACALATPAVADSAGVKAEAIGYGYDVHVSFLNYTDQPVTCSAQLDDDSNQETVSGPASSWIGGTRPGYGANLGVVVLNAGRAGNWHVEWTCSGSQESWGTQPMSPTPTAPPIAVTTAALEVYGVHTGSAALDSGSAAVDIGVGALLRGAGSSVHETPLCRIMTRENFPITCGPPSY